jgi:hypothetical protein
MVKYVFCNDMFHLLYTRHECRVCSKNSKVIPSLTITTPGIQRLLNNINPHKASGRILNDLPIPNQFLLDKGIRRVVFGADCNRISLPLLINFIYVLSPLTFLFVYTTCIISAWLYHFYCLWFDSLRQKPLALCPCLVKIGSG